MKLAWSETPNPKGMLEEGQCREHQMTRLPKNPCLRGLLQGEDPTDAERENVLKTYLIAEAKPPPAKSGEQVTGDHFIKNGRESEEDPNFPATRSR